MEAVDKQTSTEITSNVVAILSNFLDVKYGKQNYKYRIQEAAQKGDNYMGVVYRIIIETGNGLKEKLILKVPPQNPLRRKQFFARAGFLREALAYEKVFKTILLKYDKYI